VERGASSRYIASFRRSEDATGERCCTVAPLKRALAFPLSPPSAHGGVCPRSAVDHVYARRRVELEAPFAPEL
jgi:hypothetical protein